MATTSSFHAANQEEITSNIPLFEREVNAVYREVKEEFDKVLSTPSTLGPPKSNDLAQKYRLEGAMLMSTCLSEEDRMSSLLILALELITKSVALSSENSRELALSYGDRAKVFYHMKKYEQCLMDVNRALQYEQYPVISKSLLLDFHSLCMIKLNQSRKADGGRLMTGSIMSTGYEAEPVDIFEKPSLRWAHLLKNEKIPNTSHKIKMRRDHTWGRHMVASTDIEAGEILSCEDFFSLGVPPDGRFSFNCRTKETTLSKWEELDVGRYDHCSHCAKRCKNLIPCTSCTVFLFCSEKCRSLAHQEYHRTECRMGALYWDDDAHVLYSMPYFLAVRTFLTGTKQGASLENLVKTLTIRDIFEGKLDPNEESFAEDYRYRTLLKLSMTFDQDLIRFRMKNAVQVVVVLKSLGFFEGISEDFLRDEGQGPDRLNRAELFVVALLLNHFNMDKLYGYLEPKQYAVMTDGTIYHPEPLIVGTVVLHALINHACDPNADIFVSKRQHVLYARRPIEKGKQIFISYYGRGYEKPIKRARKDELGLPFTCECDACNHDWPEFPELRSFDQNQDFIVKYLSGSTESSVVQTLEQLAAPFLNPTDESRLDSSKALQIVFKIITVLHKHVERPAAVHQLENTLAIFMRLLYDEILQKDDAYLIKNYCACDFCESNTEYVTEIQNKMKHFAMSFNHKFLSSVAAQKLKTSF